MVIVNDIFSLQKVPDLIKEARSILSSVHKKDGVTNLKDDHEISATPIVEYIPSKRHIIQICKPFNLSFIKGFTENSSFYERRRDIE